MSDSDESLKGEAVPEDKVESIEERGKEEGQEGKLEGQGGQVEQVSLSQRVLTVLDDFRMGGTARVWWTVFWVFVAAALATRLHFITTPYKVVWDEAHFGKMVGWYLNRTFFLDVHPAGGKLLLTLFGYLGGYNGTHGFETPDAPYEGYHGIMPMRVGCALMGAALVPFGFHIVWTLTCSLPAATFAAGLITFEIGTITLSKFILLDPLLLFFIMASFHGLTFMHQQGDRPFTAKWWAAYVYTGAMLGCVMSVKFVGLFIVLVVGLYTALDLWQKYGELDRPLMNVAKHFVARALTLILLPLVIYLCVFYIHDRLLIKTRTHWAHDEGIFTPGFQMTIQENNLNNLTQPKEVAYGSVVTLRNANLAGKYLHSHNLTYPPNLVGKGKLQLTGFGGKDLNNHFKILFPEEDPDLSDYYYNGSPEYVTNGDWVRLFHLSTSSLVSCSQNKSLVTRKHNLAYGKHYNLTDPETAAAMNAALNADPESAPNNPNITTWQLWAVHVVGGKPGEVVHALDSRVKFLCVPLSCALAWSTEKLPLKWGHHQQEITCANNIMNPYTDWMIEQNFNPYLPNSTFGHLKSGFVSRLVETHRVMTWVNGRLKPEGNDRINGHRPWMWPICAKSQVWYDVHFRIVLLGNPIIFWINLAFLLVVPGLLIAHYYREKRGHTDTPPIRARKEKMVFACKWLLFAYLIHYVPFYTMDRILYYHHYFPALQFSSMLTAVVFGYLLESLEVWLPPRKAKLAFHWATLVFFLIILYSFHLFCYVGYGHPTNSPFNPKNSTFKDIRVFDAWEI